MLGQVLAEFRGKVRLAYKDFPLSFHEGARPAAEASRCAAAQGRYWEYHDLLFLGQPAFSRADLLGYAQRLGLRPEAFSACLDRREFRAAVEADLQEGLAAGVSRTPTFFINGRKLEGAYPVEIFREVIEEALEDAASRRP